MAEPEEPSGGGSTTTTGFPMWSLNTIFLDNGKEREGNNVDANVNAMIEWFRRQQQQQHDEQAEVEEEEGNQVEPVQESASHLAVPDSEYRDRPPSSPLVVETRTSTPSSERRLKFAPSPPKSDASKSDQRPNSPVARPRTNSSYVSTVKGLYKMLPEKVTEAPKGVAAPSESISGSKSASFRESPMHKKPSSVAFHIGDNGDASRSGLGSRMGKAKKRWKKLRWGYMAKMALVARMPKQTTSVCPHCNLRNTHPKHNVVRPVLAASYEAHYPNICLGIMSTDNAQDRLWDALGELQPSTEVSNADASLDELSTVGCNHFTQRIGVAPWVEFFIARQRAKNEAANRDQALALATTVKTRAVQDQVRKLKQKMSSIEKLLVSNPADEYQRISVQLQTVKSDFVLTKMHIDETTQKLEEARKDLKRRLATLVVVNEDARRHLASISDLVDAAGGMPNVALSRDRVRRTVANVVSQLAQANALGRRLPKKPKGTEIIDCCPDCLYLPTSSAYCTATGNVHQPPTPSFVPAPPQEPSVKSEAKPPTLDASLLRAPQRSKSSTMRSRSPSQSDADDPFEFTNRTAASDLHSVDSDQEDEGSAFTSPGDRSPMTQQSLSVTPSAPHLSTGVSPDERKLSKFGQKSGNLPKGRSDVGSRRGNKKTRQKSVVAGNMSSSNNKLSRKESRKRLFSSAPTTGLDLAQEVPTLSRKSSSQQATRKPSLDPSYVPQPAIASVPLLPPLEEHKAAIRQTSLALDALFGELKDYFSAAEKGNLRKMREVPNRLIHQPLEHHMTSLGIPSNLAAEMKQTQERFHEWYSLMLPQITGKGPANRRLLGTGGDEHLSQKAMEQEVLHLKKELRNLKYAFNKRPKGRSQHGATLDDAAFMNLALKIADSERRNMALRLRLKQVNEARRAQAKRLAALHHSDMEESRIESGRASRGASTLGFKLDESTTRASAFEKPPSRQKPPAKLFKTLSASFGNQLRV